MCHKKIWPISQMLFLNASAHAVLKHSKIFAGAHTGLPIVADITQNCFNAFCWDYRVNASQSNQPQCMLLSSSLFWGFCVIDVVTLRINLFWSRCKYLKKERDMRHNRMRSILVVYQCKCTCRYQTS